MNIIFDSNVFDDLVSGKLSAGIISDSCKIYVTHIQIDEISNCTNGEKRARLFQNVVEIQPKKIPTESFVVGVSRVGSAKVSDGDLLEKLRKGNLKRTNDALIGETAIKNNLTLVTNDNQLKSNVNSQGGKAISVDEFTQFLT